MAATLVEEISFVETGDFNACHAAEKWCADHGYSVGRMQGAAPRALFSGNYDIQKWRDLHPYERAAVDGVMVGAMRTGPVTVRVWNGII